MAACFLSVEQSALLLYSLIYTLAFDRIWYYTHVFTLYSSWMLIFFLPSCILLHLSLPIELFCKEILLIRSKKTHKKGSVIELFVHSVIFEQEQFICQRRAAKMVWCLHRGYYNLNYTLDRLQIVVSARHKRTFSLCCFDNHWGELRMLPQKENDFPWWGLCRFNHRYPCRTKGLGAKVP